MSARASLSVAIVTVVVASGCSGSTGSTIGPDDAPPSSAGSLRWGGVGTYHPWPDAGPSSSSSGAGADAGGGASGGGSSGGPVGASSSGGGSGSSSGSSGGSSSGGATNACTIGGQTYANEDVNPQNICQWCDPSRSKTAWSSITDGAACGSANEACFGGTCTSHFPDCTIDGTAYPSNAPSPTNACLMCQPRQSETEWTNAPDGSPCPGGSCFAGACD